MTEPSPPVDAFQESAELVAVLAQMGAVLLSSETIDTTVEMVTTLAAAAIPGTSGAGVSLINERGKRTAASSSQLLERADALQYEFDTGPCLTAWRDQVTVRIGDTRTDTRWPQWTSAAADLGITAMLSVPLIADNVSIGAIKVYSGQPNTYNSRAEHLLKLFARQAAILLVNSQSLTDARRLSAQLTEALANRDVIGQAKGILISRGAADDDKAFAVLVAASQRSNAKVHEVARRIIASTIARNRTS